MIEALFILGHLTVLLSILLVFSGGFFLFGLKFLDQYSLGGNNQITAASVCGVLGFAIGIIFYLWFMWS